MISEQRIEKALLMRSICDAVWKLRNDYPDCFTEDELEDLDLICHLADQFRRNEVDCAIAEIQNSVDPMKSEKLYCEMLRLGNEPDRVN
jgi:hypothetical protein